MRVPVRIVLLVLGGLAVLPACKDDAPASLFHKEAAVETVNALRSAWATGDVDAVAAECRAPFTFNGRAWTDAAALRANLAEQVPRLKAAMAEATEIEVFSRSDLEEGRWPRGETLDAAARGARIRELGVSREGFLVRIYRPRERGMLVVVNSLEGARLWVYGLST